MGADRSRVTVWAVAAESPGLWSPQESEATAELLRLGMPMELVERDGEVECLVRPDTPVREGEDLDDVVLRVDQCQLVDGDVTLLVRGTGMDLDQGVGILRDVSANLVRG